MSKKKNTAARHFPWIFLSVLLIFCIWMTYLWGVFYIPSLPREEIPPFLLSESVTDDRAPQTGIPITASTHADTEPPAAMPDTVPDAVKPPSEPVMTSSSDPETTAENAPSLSEKDVYTRRNGVYNILCAGRDDAAFNTDVLLLVSVDTKNGTASAVQIPRDTYIDGAKANALWAKKRTQAKRAGSQNPDADGMEALAGTLEEVLCIRIDHWVLCSLTALRETVDAIGGVTVCVPCDMDYDDPAQNLSIHLKKGIQRLDGSMAEGLVRFRSDYIRGDLGRVEVQKLFLTALLEQVKTVSLLKLPALMQTMLGHLTTDLTFSDVLYFAKAAQKLELSKVSFLTLPGTDCRQYGNTGAWYYVLSREGAWACVNAYLNVYEKTIDDKLFDRDYRLTDTESSAMLNYYRTKIMSDASNAEEIRDNGVEVAVLPK